MDRTPSDIELEDESHGGKYTSRESLKYKKTSSASYTLPESPTPSDLVVVDQGELQSARKRRMNASNPSKTLNSDPSIAEFDDMGFPGQTGDISLASISLLTGDHARPGKSDTTRVLEQAAQHEKLYSQSSFSTVPPRKISHSQYPQYTEQLSDPLQAYTQVFVWCLQRRIERIERNPPQDLTTSRLLELLRVLKLAQNRLVSGQIEPQLHTHDLLQLKPRMPNPENERSTQIISDLGVYRKKLLDQSRASWKLLKQAEDLHNEPAQSASISLENKYITVLEEARKENTSTVQAICAKMVRIDSLNATGLASVYEHLDQRLRGL